MSPRCPAGLSTSAAVMNGSCRTSSAIRSISPSRSSANPAATRSACPVPSSSTRFLKGRIRTGRASRRTAGSRITAKPTATHMLRDMFRDRNPTAPVTVSATSTAAITRMHTLVLRAAHSSRAIRRPRRAPVSGRDPAMRKDSLTRCLTEGMIMPPLPLPTLRQCSFSSSVHRERVGSNSGTTGDAQLAVDVADFETWQAFRTGVVVARATPGRRQRADDASAVTVRDARRARRIPSDWPRRVPVSVQWAIGCGLLVDTRRAGGSRALVDWGA